MIYVTYLFGFPVGSFRIRTVISWLLFHGLDIAAVLVLAGVGLALWRRLRDRGALALQDFAADFFPLILLFAISVTGLALTASTMWFGGAFYGFLSILHAITVIGALLYLPFGKFFHIFQRPAQLGVKLYQRHGTSGEGALCARCGARYASLMQIEDLRRVLPELGCVRRASASPWRPRNCACNEVSPFRGVDDGQTTASDRRHQPHLRAASELRTPGRLAGCCAPSRGPPGENTLLLLRYAVRHPTESA